MTTFDKREEAFEQQFAHDEELKFRATARRNKLLGLWAAEKLGLTGAQADSYALSVVMAELEDTNHDVAGKIRKDFAAKGVQGGGPGAPGAFVLNPGGPGETRLPSTSSATPLAEA